MNGVDMAASDLITLVKPSYLTVSGCVVLLIYGKKHEYEILEVCQHLLVGKVL